jgi:hypothetical protein
MPPLIIEDGITVSAFPVTCRGIIILRISLNKTWDKAEIHFGLQDQKTHFKMLKKIEKNLWCTSTYLCVHMKFHGEKTIFFYLCVKKIVFGATE